MRKQYKIEEINFNDTSIFNYINPNSNDNLSNMSGSDLQKLIEKLENYYLELRKTLGFNDQITFGLELEFEHANIKRIENEINKTFSDNSWIVTYDGSLVEGAEINSPILKDSEQTWKELELVCEIVNKNATIDKKSGGHIHIGAQTIGSEKTSWLNFIKLWSVYENIIYRFVYGDYLVPRPYINKYANQMAKKFWDDYCEAKEKELSTRELLFKLTHDKYQAVNFKHVRDLSNYQIENTIEFRCPNGTLNPVIWQNNINLFINILLYSKSTKFDDDIVSKRKKLIKINIWN